MMLIQSASKLVQMVIYNFVAVILLMDMIESGWRYGVVDGLSMNYYIMKCPFAEGIIKNTVNKALQADPTLAAGLVRMHFHDCFVEVYIESYSYAALKSIIQGSNLCTFLGFLLVIFLSRAVMHQC